MDDTPKRNPTELYVARADGEPIGDYTYVAVDGADGFFEWEDEPVECVVYRLVPTVAGWQNAAVQPTIHLVLGMERP